MNTVVERMNVLPSAQSKVPGDGLPEFHVLKDTVGDAKVDAMRAVGLLDGVPPLLTVGVDPAPVGIGGTAKSNVCASDLDPVTRESLKIYA